MGWTVVTTKLALADTAAVEVELADGVRLDERRPIRSCPSRSRGSRVLPSLDPTTMGWKQRDWYLPAAAADAFDRNGNAGPTHLGGRSGGRRLGPDARRRVRTHYFERVASARRAEIDERLAVLADAVGETRFTIRFPGRIQATILADPPSRNRVRVEQVRRLQPVEGLLRRLEAQSAGVAAGLRRESVSDGAGAGSASAGSAARGCVRSTGSSRSQRWGRVARVAAAGIDRAGVVGPSTSRPRSQVCRTTPGSNLPW